MVKPAFYARFDENWKVTERYENEEYELCVISEGELSEACLVGFLFRVPLSSKDASFLSVQGGHFSR